MAGNTPRTGNPNAIRLAIMHLNWNIPTGDAFVLWLQEVKDAGYDGITSFAHWGLESFIHAPHVLHRLLDDHGLQLAAVDAKLSTDYDMYTPIFEFMERLGSNLLVCIDPAGTEKDFAKYGDALNRIGEKALEYGIHAHYHNHTASLGETATDMEKLIEHLDFTKVSLMLDVGHATKDFTEFAYGDRAYRFLEDHWDRIHYLELKDWNESSDLNTPLGEGYADYDRIFNLVKAKGYSGWLTVEQNGNDGLSLGRSAYDTARISREFIRSKLGV